MHHMLIPTSCAGCNEPGAVICRRCRFALVSAATAHSSSGVHAALPFEGVARQVVHGLKFRNRRQVAATLAAMMVRRLHLDGPGRVDLVTWAPTSARRARDRGFDQAELLARAVARELGVPCRRLLYRAHGGAQTGRRRSERLTGPGFRARVAGRSLRVLLVDDVVTTGATMAAAVEALHLAGVGEVQCVAAAATPSRPAGRRRVRAAA